MAKSKSSFICQSCGTSHPKWQGRCNGCGAWNSLVEEIEMPAQSTFEVGKKLNQEQLTTLVVTRPETNLLKSSKQRFSSLIGELDRVLGGGIVPGAVMLLGGEPGVGKSTLLTQVSLLLAGESQSDLTSQSASTPSKSKKKKELDKRQRVLYVCGEESPDQINLRINRILSNEQFLSTVKQLLATQQLNRQIDQNLQFVTTSDVDQLVQVIDHYQPQLVIVDSIQTLSTKDLTGASGSVGQLRESAERLISVCKSQAVACFLVGHVTKEGVIAGPKVLEHMVDSVLQLEGERTGQFRLLRALKNRFGATDEVGVFKVVEYGYQEVNNPSELFLENQQQGVAGSAVACVMEGTRPLLIEVQALVNPSQLAMPRRVGRGVELSRIQVLAAVLQKHCHLPLGECDIFVSAAGGFKIHEPAADLALAVAIASSLKNKAVPNRAVFMGEVGLLGEVRQIPSIERRTKEVSRLGIDKIFSVKSHQQVRQVLKSLSL